MRINLRRVLAVLIGILPLIIFIIINKVNDYGNASASAFLVNYLIVSLLGLFFLFVIIKYFLNDKLNSYFQFKGSYLMEISLIFLLLISVYLIYSIGGISYSKWISNGIGRSHPLGIFQNMFSHPFFAFLVLGNINCIVYLFIEGTRIFLLKNIIDYSKSKVWIWGLIIFIALLFSLIYADQGLSGMISGLVISLLFNSVYYLYRRPYPLIITSLLIQIIILIEFYVLQ